MGLEERLGIEPHVVDRFGLLQDVALPDPEVLFKAALEAAQQGDEEGAKGLLAAGLLSAAQKATEGRHVAALQLLAQIVAQADARMTLGKSGREARLECMPNGWRYMAESYERLRYAWRNGLRELLVTPPSMEPVKRALDEVTRLNPAEPEPVRVAIQESWPGPRIAGLVTVFGVGLTALSVREMMLARAAREKTRRKKR